MTSPTRTRPTSRPRARTVSATCATGSTPTGARSSASSKRRTQRPLPPSTVTRTASSPMRSTRSGKGSDMRTVLAGALAAVCLAMTPTLASAHDGQSSETRTHGHTAKLAELRDVTAPYRSGPGGPWTTQVFDLAGITCIEDPNGTGTMGIHFVDPASLGDGKVNRLAP